MSDLGDVAVEIAKSVGEAFVEALPEILPKLFELFKHGGRDGVIVALDGALVVARQKTDDDLKKKHAHDSPR